MYDTCRERGVSLRRKYGRTWLVEEFGCKKRGYNVKNKDDQGIIRNWLKESKKDCYDVIKTLCYE